MSKTKWNQTEPLRYSGPELAELLDEVTSQHGPDVEIASVNRIRTGGIAGFFCKEEFEILVEAKPDLAPPARLSKVRPGVPTISAARAAAVNIDSVDAPLDLSTPIPPQVPQVPEPSRRGRLVDTARPVSAMGRSAATEPEAVSSTAAPVVPTAIANVPFDPNVEPEVSDPRPAQPIPLGGPRAPVSSHAVPSLSPSPAPASSDFGLGDTPPDSDLSDPEVRALRARAVGAGTTSDPVPVVLGKDVLARAVPTAPAPASSAAGIRRMADATPIAPAIEAAMLLTESQARTSPFWLELYRTQRELASFMPLASPFVAVVGTLPQAMVVTRRLRQGPTMGHAEVYVLTDRAGIVSEPMWNLVRSGRRLLEIAAQRADEPTIFIIDVPDEHPNWLFPLQNRLRVAGVSLFHYVVNGRPDAADLEVFRQGADLPYAIDLASRLSPSQVLEFIEHRHPVASVSGTVLTAGLGSDAPTGQGIGLSGK